MRRGIVGVIEVKPGEGVPFSHSWLPNLPTGTAVSSVAVAGTDLSDNSDVTGSLATNVSTANGITTVEVHGLTDGKDYGLALSMTRDDTGGPFKDVYLVRCRKVLL